MKVSDYRHRVSLLLTTEQDDEAGRVSEVETVFAAVYAAVEPLSGREYFAAAAVQQENTVKIRMRYSRDITAKITQDMRVKHGDRLFDIKSVINFGGRNVEIHLMCQEVQR